MPDEEEALACLMYSVYYEALGSDRWKWDQLAPNERTAWILVAQVKIRRNEMVSFSDEYLLECAIRAYDAYGAVTDHKNYQGLPMPAWDDLTDKIQAAWVGAVKSIFDNLKSAESM